MELVAPFAYGAMGLHPWELDEYTIRQFFQRAEGYRKAQKQEWRKLAALACWILAPWNAKDKPPITPAILLGEVQEIR